MPSTDRGVQHDVPHDLAPRRAVCLTAALGSIVALPVAAEAATLTTDGGDVLFAAKAGEQNDVDVFLQNDALMIRDNRAPITASGRCRNTAPGTASCGTSGNLFLKIRLGDRNDFAEMTVPRLLAQFQGDDGDDVFFANVKTPPSRAHYHGGFGFDAVDYNGSTGPIRVTLDNDDNDGRLGTNDIDNVGLTTEKIAGSAFGDILTGNDDHRGIFEDRAGVDTMIGLGQSDQFEEGPEPNGADSMFGGGGFHDAVSYRQRAGAVKVSLNDRADDGAVEGDNVDRDVEHITGGAGSDTLSGDQDGNIIDGGGGGRDVIGSGAGGDVIVGILDGAGDDTVGCGGEVDNVQFDVGDIVDADCEFRNGGVSAAQLARRP